MGRTWRLYGVCISSPCLLPFTDHISVSFHDSEDNPGSEIDDEEMEARNAAPDDDPILVD